MDNQQATCEWARLAGLLMGDGYFTMSVAYRKRVSGRGFLPIVPTVAFTNQDATLINLFAEMFEQVGIKYYIESRNGTIWSKYPISTILVRRFDSLKLLLNNLLPWLVGDKKARAELILRYISKERRGRREPDVDDAEIIKMYLAVSPKIKKGKTSRLAEVLRDYEQNWVPTHSDDIVQPAA